MKKMLILLLAFLCLSAAPCIAESEKDEPTDEWTILFYLCGSDLESRNGYPEPKASYCQQALEIGGADLAEAANDQPVLSIR